MKEKKRPEKLENTRKLQKTRLKKEGEARKGKEKKRLSSRPSELTKYGNGLIAH